MATISSARRDRARMTDCVAAPKSMAERPTKKHGSAITVDSERDEQEADTVSQRADAMID